MIWSIWLKTGSLGLCLIGLLCLCGRRAGQPQIDKPAKQIEPERTSLHGSEGGNDQAQGLQPPVRSHVRSDPRPNNRLDPERVNPRPMCLHVATAPSHVKASEGSGTSASGPGSMPEQDEDVPSHTPSAAPSPERADHLYDGYGLQVEWSVVSNSGRSG